MRPGERRQVEFTPHRLARLAQIERWHFWFIGRQALLERALTKYLPETDKTLLDVGCGTGHVLRTLIDRGYRGVGLDLRPEGLHTLSDALAQPLLLQAEATRIPVASERFDAVVLLDVLEHVDAASLLRELARVLKPSGWLLLSAPAMDWLWSYRDQAAGHVQRFDKGRLKHLLTTSGLHPQEVRYYQFFLFPLVVLSRLLARRFNTVRDLEELRIPLLNPLFAAINRFEVKWGEIIPWPWGSSIFAVCQKVPSR